MADKKDALQTTADASLTVPEGLEGMFTLDRPEGADTGTLGNEGIGRDDILMPRLGLAQKMSPEIDGTSPKYIPGLQFMDLYNSLTKQVYARGPVYFAILRRDEPRWVEFNPLDEGGGIKRRNVPADDPATEFGPNGEKPAATKFYDFIVLLLNETTLTDPLQNIVVLSLKGSAIKAAKQLNMLIQQRGPKKIFKGAYQLKTGHETDKKSSGVYATYEIKNSGWLKGHLETLAAEMFEAWEDRALVIDHEIDDSMAANPESPDTM